MIIIIKINSLRNNFQPIKAKILYYTSSIPVFTIPISIYETTLNESFPMAQF